MPHDPDFDYGSYVEDNRVHKAVYADEEVYEKELENDGLLGVGFQPQFVRQKGGFKYDTLNVNSGDWGTYGDLNNDQLPDLMLGNYRGGLSFFKGDSIQKRGICGGAVCEFPQGVYPCEYQACFRNKRSSL